MTSTETKITFETLPKAVEEIKVELVHLKGTVERLLELSSGTQRDSWMNIDQCSQGWQEVAFPQVGD